MRPTGQKKIWKDYPWVSQIKLKKIEKGRVWFCEGN